MELLELVTGWLDATANSFVKIGKVIFYDGWFSVEDKSGVVEEEGESRSAQGYRFEHEEIKALMYRLRNFETVEFTSAKGTPLTPEMIEQRWGSDGGIDCVIRIVAPTERGARNVQGRIRKILIEGDY